MKGSNRLIQIVSAKGDYMSFHVIEWLYANSCNFKRYDADQTIDMSYSLSNELDAVQNTDEITWIRKGRKLIFDNDERGTDCYDFYIREQKTVLEFDEVNSKTIGSYIKEINHNKLLSLNLAKEVGFKIPPTIVTTEKKILADFLKLHGNIITKEISNLMKINLGNTIINGAGTFEVDRESLKHLEDKFDISLFQKRIASIFELRVFVFLKNIYAMAIFKHKDDTKIDSRYHDEDKNPRYVPYKLPINVERRILDFCTKLTVNTGSFDFLVDKNLDFYFLEVNIQGEFHWTSEYCNYCIEKDIAQVLIKFN